MGAPVLTVFTDAAPCPRVEVFFPSFDAGTASVTVYRLSGGREFRVRGAVRAVTAGSLSRIDFEVPLNREVAYRAEQFDAAGVSLGFTPTTTLGGQYTPWVEVRRNGCVNPKPIANTGWQSVGVQTITADGLVATLNTSTTPYMFSARGAGGAVSGRIYAMSAKVRATPVSGQTNPTSVQMRPHRRTGNAYYTPDGGSVAVPVDGTQYTVQFYWTATVDIADSDIFDLTAVANAAAPIGFALAMDEVLIEEVPTKPATFSTFFYGGTVPASPNEQQYRFVGATGNSASVAETRASVGIGVVSAESWMHNPLDPQGSTKVIFGEDGGWSITRPSPGVVSHPKGRRVGVVLSEPRQGVVGLNVTVRTSSDEDADRVQAMFGDEGRPPVVCIRMGKDDSRLRIAQPLFLSTLTVDEVDMNTRWGGTELAHKFEGDEVDPPIPGLFVPLLTRKDLNTVFATRSALNAAGLTRADINRLYQYAGAAG